ncbi:hypothetical protein [Frankia sp. CcI49]|uniref:hypothetical protein n=1 Tax=Frankia sp. CcI49 TaxID=1745382 RepID=UPI0013044136|nr:hypothetical protein [Frankia sp. CcI49]
MGPLTAGAAALVNQGLIAAAISLAVLAVVFLGWQRRRRSTGIPETGGPGGCGGGCAC